MSDYINTFGGAAKDAANADIIAAEHDTEYNSIEESIATKVDKYATPTNTNILTVAATSDLQDSGVQLGGAITADFSALPSVTNIEKLAKIYHFRTTTTSGTTTGNVSWTYTRTSIYTEIEHDLGHTNFTVMATVQDSTIEKCAVLAKSSTIFRIYPQSITPRSFEVIVIED